MTANNSGRQSEIPHSWDLSTWPSGLFPEDPERARWLIRAYRDELMRCGALARVGKTLVILGKGYSSWLSQRAAHVPGYISNNPRMRSSGADLTRS